jgi:hypothetical protein
VRSRLLITAVVAVVIAGLVSWYVAAAAHRSTAAANTGAPVSLSPGRILFRSTAPGSAGRLALVDRGDPGGPRTVSTVSCNRVYAAGGTALCLRPDGPLATYQLAWFDRGLSEKDSYPIVGVPNRARVSGDGTLVTWTAFVTGDSYNGGKFSTRVGILNVRTGDAVQTLEDFAVTRDGRPYSAADWNFWGVTVAADDRTFYATMSSGGRRTLMQGDLVNRTMTALADNVECPSLSPDGTRLAFKQAVGGDPARGWRLAVLDLATRRVTPLAEARSVDDQAAWLDAHTVMYALPHGTNRADVWAVPADGTGAPARLIPDAESPAAL